jgi:hypothetical protein
VSFGRSEHVAFCLNFHRFLRSERNVK